MPACRDVLLFIWRVILFYLGHFVMPKLNLENKKNHGDGQSNDHAMELC